LATDPEEKTTLYLIVPAPGKSGPRQTQDDAVQDEGVRDYVARKLFGGREEVKVDPQTVINQITNYITVVSAVAANESAVKGEMKLSEITLNLTLSASGNIGIASTSAEAGISVVFKRE